MNEIIGRIDPGRCVPELVDLVEVALPHLQPLVFPPGKLLHLLWAPYQATHLQALSEQTGNKPTAHIAGRSTNQYALNAQPITLESSLEIKTRLRTLF